VDEQEWIEQQAPRVRRALEAPRVAAEVAGLLGLDDDGRRRQRRLEQARRELAGLEITWRLGEDETAWEA
jgi:hypothetical protein